MLQRLRCFQLLVLFCGIYGCNGLTSMLDQKMVDSSTMAHPKNSSGPRRSTSRRCFLGLIPSAATMLSFHAKPATALQPRNEALCGTGFFTNIALYKCTEIGDISDEGKSQPLSSLEEGSLQSLMGKLGMENVEIVDDSDSIKRKANKESQGSQVQMNESPKT